MHFLQRLNDIRQRFETGGTPREVIEVLDQHIEWLLAENVASRAISLGSIAPMSQSVHSDSGDIPVRELFSGEFVVMTWFRGNW
jgi:hypothetical protein